jgi:hypothetical protein
MFQLIQNKGILFAFCVSVVVGCHALLVVVMIIACEQLRTDADLASYHKRIWLSDE